MLKALRIILSGRVQGVGFRPFIHRIAVESGVSGYVRNMGGGEVEIWAEGGSEELERFLKLLRLESPPPARIDSVRMVEERPNGFEGFRIMSSGREVILDSTIPQDLAVCRWCLEEVAHGDERRRGYPFNSCAWCGPRYSMMYRQPYDRENTSMNRFPLCDECLREYRDIGDKRRYHAQGISCSRCGPRLRLLDSSLREIRVSDPIEYVAGLIDGGGIVAVKGIGGYHIACLATDDDVVLELRRRKRRPRKPLALMALDIDTVERIAEIPQGLRELLEGEVRPIVLLRRRIGSPVSQHIAPGLKTLGIMLPYTPLHYLRLSRVRDRFLVMTSGNLHGDPMVRSEHQLKTLSGIVDAFLTHDREIVNRVDDPVFRPTLGGVACLRCGRGVAPLTLKPPIRFREVYAAFGSELQTAPAIGFRDKVVLAPYQGDADNPRVLREHLEALDTLLRFYGLEAGRVVADLHPLYATRQRAERLAKASGVPLILVQHHIAHMASAMLEHGHRPEEPAVGVIMDGVGYGLDGAVWGGEIITWDSEGFTRVGRLEYHVAPGGDLAARYPARMLASILTRFMDEDEITRLMLERGVVKGLPRGLRELESVLIQVRSGRPLTSSTGRLLDSVSALLGICLERTYEGEPAIMLEEHSMDGRALSRPPDLITRQDGETVILTSRIVEYLLDRLGRESIRDLGYSAQYFLGYALGEAAAEFMRSLGSRTLYVSGGAAVNQIILRGIMDGAGVEPRLNRLVPANDGGIAVGQVYAAALMEGQQPSSLRISSSRVSKASRTSPDKPSP